jgi:urocanate hydratase
MNIVSRHVSARRGATLPCKGWPHEAALKRLMDDLDSGVAERPDDLSVYGTHQADEKLQRGLTCDRGIGVARHADAGNPGAIDTARRHGIDMPSLSVHGGARQ